MTATIHDIRPEWLHPTRRALLLSVLAGSTGDLLRGPLDDKRLAYAMLAPSSPFDGLAVSTLDPTDETDGGDLAANVAWLRAAAQADDLGFVWHSRLIRVTHSEAHGWRFSSEVPADVWSLPL